VTEHRRQRGGSRGYGPRKPSEIRALKVVGHGFRIVPILAADRTDGDRASVPPIVLPLRVRAEGDTSILSVIG